MLPRNGDPVVQVLDKLDTIIDLLRVSIGAAPSAALANLFPDLAGLFQSGGTPATQALRQSAMLEYLVAASLPSAPENVRTVTVPTVQTLLASNESQPLMRVDVSNLDPAQPLTVSKRGVTVVSGIQVLARTTVPFVLPIGSELYGLAALGTIITAVSTGYDMRPILNSLFTGS